MQMKLLIILCLASYSCLASSPVCNGIHDDSKLGCVLAMPNDEQTCFDKFGA